MMFSEHVSGYGFRNHLRSEMKTAAWAHPTRLGGCFTSMLRVSLTVACLFPIGLMAEAQILPEEPFVFVGGRLVVSGEVTGSIAAEDPGFYNYTDYEQNALRLLRLDVSVGLSLGPKAAVLSEVRSETRNPFEVYALFLRVRPWESRSIDVQAGRIPPTFGAFSRRRYGTDNPLIGYPLLYQYLTSLRADALPVNANDLLTMRGRGWRPMFPFGKVVYVKWCTCRFMAEAVIG